MSSSTGFGVFSLSADAPANDPGVDNHGRAIRRRRYHAKSRDGCLNCKSRKIKCDERRPTCRKCSTRGLRCDFDQSTGERELAVCRDGHNQASLLSNSGTGGNVGTRRRISGDASGGRLSPSIGELGVPALDLESLRLMHHFEHFTSGTLLFDEQLWRDQILPLALQNEYLMRAVLTVSASHLHYLQPHISRHSRVAAMHLDRSLSGFRESLNKLGLPQQNPDVIIACGFILLHYAWSIPFFNVPNDRSPDIESDGLLWFAGGVKTIILSVYKKDEGEPVDGIFQSHITKNHSKRFYDWSDQADCSYDFEQNFLRQSCPAREPVPDGCLLGRGTVNAAERLVPIFRTVDALTRGQDISDIMSSVLAYTLMWPSKAMPNFLDSVRDGDIDAMVTMLSFYASSWKIMSERAWWAHHRPKVMCQAILEHLSRERPSEWDQNISKITEYFGFNKNCDGNWEIGNPTVAQVA
ncbi:hypothetical protein F5Y04DRAFT_189623 [Hypomontagnella monticulosa]|nr:hypothetical protein F5Y04DRAFT_189623 [Hypomontagnella monticulosa]